MATYDLAYPGAAIDAILNTSYFLQEAGYIFQGSASEYSGTPSKRVWLIAPAGSTGFGLSSAVPQGSIGICLYNGTSWVGKIINVATIDSTPTQNSGNAVSSGGAYAAINQLSASVTEALENLTFTDTTPSAFQDEYINMKVSTTEGGVERILTYFTILAATTSKAGLLSAADKVKIDSFLTNLRSLTFADTTASADQGTKITETLKATIGGVQEVIDSITLLAATSSKAGLLSASDKAYIDALPATLTSLSNSISGALALMQSLVGYYVCDTAAATAAKTVTATGYSLTNGGCIRIKMTNANTAANVTLNINSTGAKALYYDGTQASSTNTWEAGEVLEVYYDGTQYQCASGGGKINIIHSIDPTEIYDDNDVAGADALQNADANIAELSEEIYGSPWADVTGWITGKYIATNQGVGSVCPMTETTLSQMNYVKILAHAGEKYHLIGVGGNTPRFWATIDLNTSKIISAANGYTGSLAVPEDVTLTINQDCWLIVNVYNSAMTPPYNNDSHIPYSVKKETTPAQSRIDIIESKTNDLDEMVGDLYDPYYDLSSDIIWIDGYYINSSTGGTVYNTNYCISQPFDISGYLAVRLSMMTVASNTTIGLAWYDSNNAYISGQASYNTGIAGYEEHTYDVPANAKYIRVTTRKSDKASFTFVSMKNNISTRLISAEDKVKALDAKNISVSWVGNGAIDYVTGTVLNSTNTKYSDYIEISDYDFLYVSNVIMNAISQVGLAFYDSSKTYISGKACTYSFENGADIRKYAVPSTAKYIRVTFWKTDTYGAFKIYEARETDNNYEIPNVSVYAINDYTDYGLRQGGFAGGSFIDSATRVHLPLISAASHISVKSSYYILYIGRMINGRYDNRYDSVDSSKYRRSLYLPKIDNVAYVVVIARTDGENILPTDDIIDDMSYLDYEDKLANLSSDDSEELSMLTLSEAESVVGTAMNYILKDEYENNVRYLRLSDDCGKTWTSIQNTFGDIVFVHWFSTGSLLFATPSKCYYSDDGLTTVHESDLYDLNGTTFVAEATEHFFQNDQARNPIMMVGDTEIVAWGDYYFNDAAYKGRAWFSDDYGHSVRCFFKSGESVINGSTISVRHTHGVLYDQYTEKFYLITGDGASECCLIECVYSQGNWSLTLLGRGANYKFGDIRFDKYFMYFVTDYTETSQTNRGILRCPKTGLSNFSNYKFIAKAPSDYGGSIISFIEDRNGNKMMFPDLNGRGRIWYCKNTFDFETVPVSENVVLTNVTDPNYNGDVYCRKSLSTTPFKLNPMINLTKSMRNSGIKDFFVQNNVLI